MGREVRRVPPDWKHPKDGWGRYEPMHDQGYREALGKWEVEREQWEKGFRKGWKMYGEPEWVPREGDQLTMSFEDWHGERPDPRDYRPDWPEETRTHYQMYETCSEGTPISPIFATPEELAHWLADSGASAFAGMTATYEQWLRVCRGGYAPSAVADASGIRPGVSI